MTKRTLGRKRFRCAPRDPHAGCAPADARRPTPSAALLEPLDKLGVQAHHLHHHLRHLLQLPPSHLLPALVRRAFERSDVCVSAEVQERGSCRQHANNHVSAVSATRRISTRLQVRQQQCLWNTLRRGPLARSQFLITPIDRLKVTGLALACSSKAAVPSLPPSQPLYPSQLLPPWQSPAPSSRPPPLPLLCPFGPSASRSR